MDHQESSHPIRLYSNRSTLYKMGCLVVFISFLMYMYCFISPNWILGTEKNGEEFSKGLWSSCSSVTCESTKNMLMAIKAMACFCVAGYVFTIIVGLFDNCRLVSPDYHSRKLEWSALVTGTTGILMDILYIFFYFVRIWDATLNMVIVMNFSAMIVLFVAVALIACNNRNPRVGRGAILSRQPMVVQYNSGQTHASVPSRQADIARSQNEPILHPSGAPPPYSLPPSYATAVLKT